MNLKKLLVIFLFISLSSSLFSSDELPSKKQNKNKIQLNRSWYKDLFFEDENFNFEAIRMLGTAYNQGTDIGECISTIKYIKDKNYKSWYDEWYKTAERIYKKARKMEKSKNIVSARELYFRAASYYEIAGFYLHAPKTRKIAVESWQKGRDSFIKAIESMPNISTIKIPYENTTLPGYLIKSQHTKGKAPLLIVNTGFDGTKEGLYFAVGQAAAERGYHCLMFDGPGQGEVIRLQNIPFRYDWEKVIEPVVDFAVKLPDIDTTKIALMGRSMGGYLAPRAAAFEKRLSACIANGGVYRLNEGLYKNLPPALIKAITKNPSMFNTTIERYCKYSSALNWFITNGMWTFDAPTQADFFIKLEKYNMADVAENITCPTLVIDSQDDFFFEGQPQMLYSKLTCPKTLLVFSESEDAELHCQMGATGIANEEIFAWLNKTFNYYPFSESNL